MSIDLSQLPAPAIIEASDFETLLAERKASFLALCTEDERAEMAARLALESDPIAKLLQESTYRELLLRQRINESARAVMLAFAGSGDLDHIGANYEVQRLADEPDAAYRARIQLSFEGFSTAGPEGAYRFHALSADARVLDASAYSPREADGRPSGRVIITALSREEGGVASDELIATVTAALNHEEVRPLTDALEVQPAEQLDFQVHATLYTLSGPDRQVVLDTARAQLDAYIADRYRLGRDVSLSGLFRALHAEGTQRVVMASPVADIVTDQTQAARCTGITIEFGGTDD